MKKIIKKFQQAESIYLILSLFALLLFIVFSPNKFISDENDYVPNILVLKKFGLSIDFLLNIRSQSPGPLYQIIYNFINYILPIEPKTIRILNCFLERKLHGKSKYRTDRFRECRLRSDQDLKRQKDPAKRENRP